MSTHNRQELLAKWITGGLAKDGYVVAPGSGSTITIWDSGSNEGTGPGGLGPRHNSRGVRWKRLIWNGFTSHISAANGLSFEMSHDDGANWDVIVQFTVAATTSTQEVIMVAAPRLRVQYANSANVLTAWRGSLVGDEYERGTQ